MQRLTRVLVLLLVVLLAGAVQAQELVTKTFPVYGTGVYSRLSPDGRYLAIYEDGILQNNTIYADLLPIRIYDVTTGQEVSLLVGEADYAVDIAFSPDGTQLAALYQTGWIYIWSVADGEVMKQIPVAPNVARLAWLADGETLAVTGMLPPQIQLWDIESGAMTALLTERYATITQMREALGGSGPPDGMAGFAASADGNLFAVATYYGRIFLWTRDGVRTFFYDSNEENPTFAIRELSFTPDGQTLVALNNRADKLMLFDVDTAQVREIESPAERLFGLTVSRDGAQAAWLTVTERAVSLNLADIASAEVNSYALNTEDEAGRVTPQIRLHFTLDDSQLVLTGQLEIGLDPEDQTVTMITLPR